VAKAAGDEPVRAYGGAVWREGIRGIEVLLVHRPAYQDWSLPKGKLDPGEEPTACALREVEEETGVACTIGEELGSVTYEEHNKRKGVSLLKEVTFFEMRPSTTRHRPPDDEVDEMCWSPIDEARELCTYPTDHRILDALEELLARRPTAPA
jgi:8-oxo-dGTP diphosphatase